MQNHWHLQEKDFFWDLPLEKEEFVSLAARKSLKKNDIIFHEEDPGRSCYYLEKDPSRFFA